MSVKYATLDANDATSLDIDAERWAHVGIKREAEHLQLSEGASVRSPLGFGDDPGVTLAQKGSGEEAIMRRETEI